MEIVFETFLERLSQGIDEADFRAAMAEAAAEFDLLIFAYLSLPPHRLGKPKPISNYPDRWTAHYLRNRYQEPIPSLSTHAVAHVWEINLSRQVANRAFRSRR